MAEYVTTAVINAPPARVWDIVTNAAGYREWNPEITNIEGQMASGARIVARVKLGSGAVRRVSMRVTAFHAPARMEWTGGLPFGLFVGRRTFTVTPNGSGAEFRLHVSMTGPLSRWIVKSVGDRQPEVDSFAAALKAWAERDR